MKRSTLSMLVLFLALWFAFSGPAAANVTKLTFWTFIPQHARFFDVMAEKWNELHPDRPVELESSVMPYDDMHNKLQIALQSGVGAPDICDIEISRFPNYLMGVPSSCRSTHISKPISTTLSRRALVSIPRTAICTRAYPCEGHHGLLLCGDFGERWHRLP